MSDYISRDVAVNGIAKIINESDMPEDWNKGMSAAMSALFRIPAADVRPVVLCRDCVNYGEMLSGYDHRLICHKFALTTKPNFYCACGERRNFGTDMREEQT